MKKVFLLICLASALSLPGCDQGGPGAGGIDKGDVPAQSFQNAIAALGVEKGDLIGQILFTSEYAQHSIRFSLNQITFVTQPDGRFLIRRIPAGEHTLRVRIKGYEVLERTLTISGEKDTILPPIRLIEARGWVLGRLVKERGGSAEGIEVHLEPKGGVTVTDGDGIFQFLGVNSGPHVLRIKDHLYFTGNKHFRLNSNERRNLGNIQVFRQKRLDSQTARLPQSN